MQRRSPSILVLVLLAAGCSDEVWTQPNPDHCTRNEGDQYCAERFPDAPYCNSGRDDCFTGSRYGCLAEVAPECRAPCGVPGDESCIGGESSSTGSGSGTESGSGSSEGESSSTGPMPCVGNEECTDAAAPFCEVASGECVGCDGTADPDGACAELDPMAPLCVGGACVQCIPENPVVCDDQLLLCDAGTNSCTACTEHAQCGSGACELAVGRCFPEDFVVTVDGDGGADYMTVVAAVAAVDDGTSGVIVVHELDGSGSYQNPMPLVIDGGKTIALLAAPGEAPRIQGTGGNPGLRAEGVGTILYTDGLEVSLTGGGGRGLEVAEAFAWVDRSRIVQNSGGGVLASNAGELTLRNCFVALNGGQFVDTRGITAADATLTLVYNTIAANDGTGATGPISLACDGATSGQVRNNIVAAGDDTIACSGVSFERNVVDTGGLAGSNNEVLSFDPGWFPNIAMSDFHIGAGPPFVDVAEWRTGDPTTDIDGDPRPTEGGTPDYAGADVP